MAAGTMLSDEARLAFRGGVGLTTAAQYVRKQMIFAAVQWELSTHASASGHLPNVLMSYRVNYRNPSFEWNLRADADLAADATALSSFAKSDHRRARRI